MNRYTRKLSSAPALVAQGITFQLSRVISTLLIFVASQRRPAGIFANLLSIFLMNDRVNRSILLCFQAMTIIIRVRQQVLQ